MASLMVHVNLIEPDRTWREIDADVGDTLMTVATTNLVKGIIGECGGGMSCATCYVFVDESGRDVLGDPEQDENGMLETTATPATSASRLSCQVVVTEALHGLTVRVADAQQQAFARQSGRRVRAPRR